ncbi:MAG TPA: carotenoid oxygenase family protein [Archangium sp.]|uniref:carotenoid oxygenase family protein n=1 Tax=Archangium sp. TaxID=1872627 RepID=UPI002E2ECAFD|nr:carotenoid oxygenase family protein [Archangium sp.]HEX5745677.1 carotenoid oxygenase family protein [Archangium sp.]
MMPIAAAAPPPSPGKPSWLNAYRDFTRDHGFQPMRLEGRLPEDLKGTLVRVGPVSFGVGEQRYGHWFDGDGGALAVRFAEGGAWGAARAIDTPSIRAERTAGKVLYSNYGTAAPSLWRRMFGGTKNAANTSAMTWNGRLFALVESTIPTELSLEDLRTLGETTFEGVVGPAFSAHPHRVGSRRAAYNFGVHYGRVPLLDLYELPDSGPIRRMGSVPLPGMVMIHDFIATERHLLFFVAPMRIRIFRVLLGLGSFSDNFDWRPELGTEVLVIPIDEPSKVMRFQAEPFYTWHFGNAFEQDGRIVVDSVRYPDFGTNQWLAEQIHGWASTDAQGRLHRTTIDPKAGTLRTEQISDRRCEFPGATPLLSGARHRYVYLAAHSGQKAWRGPQDALVKVDMETGRETVVTLGREHYASEPVFIPRPGGSAEDDGWLLAQTYDATSDQTYLAVLDARTPEAGPVARAWLDHGFPFTFHGTWVPAA